MNFLFSLKINFYQPIFVFNPSNINNSMVTTFKYFLTTREVGVTLKDVYNVDISAREAGKIGGQMVKKMIESYEQNMK